MNEIRSQVHELAKKGEIAFENSRRLFTSGQSIISLFDQITEHPEFKRWWDKKGNEIKAAAKKTKTPTLEEIQNNPEFRDWRKKFDKKIKAAVKKKDKVVDS